MHSRCRALRHSGTDVGSNKRSDTSDKCSYFRSIKGTDGTYECPDVCANVESIPESNGKPDSKSNSESDAKSDPPPSYRRRRKASSLGVDSSSFGDEPRSRMRSMHPRSRS